IALMMSQIQPHFMYNTLQAIQVLCRKDSDTAQKTIVKFSEYLRHNMDFVEMKGLISFKEDFNHIKCYVDIEQIRFQERLRMAYDIQVDDFMIPPLSIQPLVENAIKHGICKKAEGGTVIVRTRKEANRIIIEVMDNGIGFDTAILKETNTKSMGTRNVRFRLEHMVGATLTIKSIPGEGTYQVVSIPQEENKNENYNC
ncbi:MAG: histidine kinase, partial [Eubacterium sp.]